MTTTSEIAFEPSLAASRPLSSASGRSGALVADAGRGLSESPGRGRVLVIEDEADVRELIALHLRRDGLEVKLVAAAEEGLRSAASEAFQLVVLDWMLPGMSGVEFARALRAAQGPSGLASILMVTAKADAADVVEGLESGADDYLAKPFEPAVLMARVRALLRRAASLAVPKAEPASTSSTSSTSSSSSVGRSQVRLGALVMDPDSYEVACAGQSIALTPSEFKLLLALAQNRGRVLTRDSLIQCVQGEGVSVVGRTVDTHVFGLRKKLGACADAIETVRGVGYRVRADDGVGRSAE